MCFAIVYPGAAFAPKMNMRGVRCRLPRPRRADLLVLRDDVQHLEHLPLVLVQALDHHVEHVVLADLDAVALSQHRRQARLVARLDGDESLAELRVVRERPRVPEPLEVDGPARRRGLR